MSEIILKAKNDIKIILIDNEKAVEEFSKHDLFVNSMSKFDIQSRLKVDDNADISVNAYINFITRQIIEWNDENTKIISDTINSLNHSDIIKYFKFPEIIYIIVTNGNDEGNSAYCRNMNLIIMPENKIKKEFVKNPKTGLFWNETLIHELFHIWSRNNLEIREKFYEIIGYHKTPKVISFPDELKELKITNPDAPITQHYISLKYNNELCCMAPILIAKTPYDIETKKNFFSYISFEFIILDDNTLEPTNKIVKLNEVEEALYEKIGKNTDYIIYPEETMADNFVLLIQNKDKSDIPNPEILQNMKNILFAHDS